MDLDEVADELYEVPPEDFIELRTARQDEARAAGDKELAKAIAGLPKPSTAAWASNLLVRAQRADIEALVELGGLLREAQENLAGDQMRALSAQRNQLVSALSRQAAGLARERGRRISSAISDQVEETLRAAMADPEAGEALLTGRLTSPMSYSGLGTTVSRPDLRLVRPPAAERTPARPSRPAVPRDRPSADERKRAREREREQARRAAEQQRRRELEEARRAADEAAAQAEEAQAAAEDEKQRIGELEARRASLESRVAELADQLAHAEGEVTEVAAQLRRAERRRKSAEHEAAEAVVARERALAHLADLEDDGD